MKGLKRSSSGAEELCTLSMITEKLLILIKYDQIGIVKIWNSSVGMFQFIVSCSIPSYEIGLHIIEIKIQTFEDIIF